MCNGILGFFFAPLKAIDGDCAIFRKGQIVTRSDLFNGHFAGLEGEFFTIKRGLNLAQHLIDNFLHGVKMFFRNFCRRILSHHPSENMPRQRLFHDELVLVGPFGGALQGKPDHGVLPSRRKILR